MEWRWTHFDEVKTHDSVHHLLESIPVVLKASHDGDIVGVVIDADISLPSRWQSLRDKLFGLEYVNVPEMPAHDGTILDPAVENCCRV